MVLTTLGMTIMGVVLLFTGFGPDNADEGYFILVLCISTCRAMVSASQVHSVSKESASLRLVQRGVKCAVRLLCPPNVNKVALSPVETRDIAGVSNVASSVELGSSIASPPVVMLDELSQLPRLSTVREDVSKDETQTSLSSTLKSSSLARLDTKRRQETMNQERRGDIFEI